MPEALPPFAPFFTASSRLWSDVNGIKFFSLGNHLTSFIRFFLTTQKRPQLEL
nr:MAG TPA: hypothetical protein [Bacteriophage sp.]